MNNKTTAFGQGRTSLENRTAARFSTSIASSPTPPHRAAEDRIENEPQQAENSQAPVPAQEGPGEAGRDRRPEGRLLSIGNIVKDEYGALFMIERYQNGKWIVVALLAFNSTP